jgi:alpha-L-fucosidase
LNFPIDTRGLIHENDERAALEFADAVKKAFEKNLAAKKKITATNVRGNSKHFDAGLALDENKNTYWSTDDHVKQAALTIDLGKPTKFNRFLVQEYIPLGQRVKSFSIEALIEGKWKELSKGTTIGYKRILRFPGVTASQVRLNIKDAKGSPLIANIGIYNAPQILTPPTVIRNQKGEVVVIPADSESEIYYTTDGSRPSIKSKKYTGPVNTQGKIHVNAMAYDPASGKSSFVTNEKFDIDRSSWKLLFSNDSNLNKDSNAANANDLKSDEEIANLKKAYAVIDGDPNTSWHQNKNLPVDLIIDMGKDEMLTGFSYLPDQNVWNPGIISNYEFYISSNGNEWKLVSSGEFSNIKNNPLWQTKSFKPVKGRYIKLRALKNIEGNQEIGYAEIDVVTQRFLNYFKNYFTSRAAKPLSFAFR